MRRATARTGAHRFQSPPDCEPSRVCIRFLYSPMVVSARAFLALPVGTQSQLRPRSTKPGSGPAVVCSGTRSADALAPACDNGPRLLIDALFQSPPALGSAAVGPNGGTVDTVDRRASTLPATKSVVFIPHRSPHRLCLSCEWTTSNRGAQRSPSATLPVRQSGWRAPAAITFCVAEQTSFVATHLRRRLWSGA